MICHRVVPASPSLSTGHLAESPRVTMLGRRAPNPSRQQGGGLVPRPREDHLRLSHRGHPPPLAQHRPHVVADPPRPACPTRAVRRMEAPPQGPIRPPACAVSGRRFGHHRVCPVGDDPGPLLRHRRRSEQCAAGLRPSCPEDRLRRKPERIIGALRPRARLRRGRCRGPAPRPREAFPFVTCAPSAVGVVAKGPPPSRVRTGEIRPRSAPRHPARSHRCAMDRLAVLWANAYSRRRAAGRPRGAVRGRIAIPICRRCSWQDVAHEAAPPRRSGLRDRRPSGRSSRPGRLR